MNNYATIQLSIMTEYIPASLGLFFEGVVTSGTFVVVVSATSYGLEARIFSISGTRRGSVRLYGSNKVSSIGELLKQVKDSCMYILSSILKQYADTCQNEVHLC